MASLVVKVPPSDAEQKTELGLVKLRVQTAADVAVHAAAFRVQRGKPTAGELVPGFGVKHPRQEPSALAAHARICAGAGCGVNRIAAATDFRA